MRTSTVGGMRPGQPGLADAATSRRRQRARFRSGIGHATFTMKTVNTHASKEVRDACDRQASYYIDLNNDQTNTAEDEQRHYHARLERMES